MLLKNVFCSDSQTLLFLLAKWVDNTASVVCAFVVDHESDLSRISEQTSMFTCAGLHVTNPVTASRCSNMRTASKSVCSVLWVFQCWSSLPCQRNPVHSGAESPLRILLPSCWQGRYSRCQRNPLSQPPRLLLRESWRHFQRRGCPADLWEMQSFVSDRCKAMWREQHWNHVTECQQSIASLTITLSFVSLSPLSLCPSLSLVFISLCCSFFTKQGFEKGWSDYRGTAEEDCEQPQSSRISHQEWTSTSLKGK